MDNTQRELIENELGAAVIEQKWDHYGLTIVETAGGDEYALALSEAEADAACAEYIRNSAWAFNTDFIIEHSSALDFDEASKVIVNAIQKLCESGNDAMLRLIDDVDTFIQDAIDADGRGNFLSGYDGRELDLGDGVFLYRIN